MTNKGHFNMIVNKALLLNKQLRKLQQKAIEIADMCKIHSDDYDYSDWEFELAELNNVLEDLSNFDLEDAIPEKHTNNY